MEQSLPDIVADESQLDKMLTAPSLALREFIPQVTSPLVVLGAGGKMGPTLAVLAKHAADLAGHPLEVVAVSRFSDATPKDWLEQNGVQTLSADLLDQGTWASLPESENIINLVGQKFGTSNDPGRTWVTNTLVPAAACNRYAQSRIVALSTGCVYPMVPVASGGATENTDPDAAGEYVNACLARERIYDFYSRQHGTEISIIRLNYAIDLRYGVLFDIASKVHAGEPVDLEMGHFNCIWQGDANEMIIRSLSLCESPAREVNLTGDKILSVRDIATRLGDLLDRDPEFTGTESGNAWLNDASRTFTKLGKPPTPLEAMLRWTAHWVKIGGRSLDKPTHFEVRDGKF